MGIRIGPCLRDIAGHLGQVAAFSHGHTLTLQAQGIFGHRQVGAPLQRRPHRRQKRNILHHQRQFIHQLRLTFRRGAHQPVERRIGHILVVTRLQHLRAKIRHLDLRAQLVVVRRHPLPPPRLGVGQLPLGGFQCYLVHPQQVLAEYGLVIGTNSFALHALGRRLNYSSGPFVIELGRSQRSADPSIE